jgi:hypothetical protein
MNAKELFVTLTVSRLLGFRISPDDNPIAAQSNLNLTHGHRKKTARHAIDGIVLSHDQAPDPIGRH